LGNTLAEITREKVAILRPGCKVVVAPQEREVTREIQKVARKRRCRLEPPLYLKGMKTRLLGDFQKLNAAMAFRAAAILRESHHFPITEDAMRRGISSNHWPGRMEVFSGKPSILLDGAHNPKSVEVLSRNLNRIFGARRKILIFGTSRDKRSERMFPFLSKVFDVCILTQSDNSRAKEVSALLSEARPHFKTLLPTASSKEALELAQKLAFPGDLIVATGSFYLIGEIRPECRN